MCEDYSYSFVCPGCGERIGVSGQMRDALLANGCPLCSTAVEVEHIGSRCT